MRIVLLKTPWPPTPAAGFTIAWLILANTHYTASLVVLSTSPIRRARGQSMSMFLKTPSPPIPATCFTIAWLILANAHYTASVIIVGAPPAVRRACCQLLRRVRTVQAPGPRVRAVIPAAVLVLGNTPEGADLLVTLTERSVVGGAYCERMGGVDRFQWLDSNILMADGISVRGSCR